MTRTMGILGVLLMMSAQAEAQYVTNGPLIELGDELSLRLTNAEEGSFDILAFSDCHLQGSTTTTSLPPTTTAEADLTDVLQWGQGTKLIWGLGDYGPPGRTAPLQYNHDRFNLILDQELGPPGARSPEIALITGNHEWYDGVGKATAMQDPYADLDLGLVGDSNDRYLYYSVVAGDPDSGPAVALINLDAGTRGLSSSSKSWICAEGLSPEEVHWAHQESVRFRRMGVPVVYGLHEPPLYARTVGGPLKRILNAPSCGTIPGDDLLEILLQFDNAWGSVHGHVGTRYQSFRYAVGGAYRDPFEVNVVNMTARGLRVYEDRIELLQFDATGATPIGTPPTDYGNWGRYPNGVEVFGHATVSSDPRRDATLPMVQRVSGDVFQGDTIDLSVDNAPPQASGWLAVHENPNLAGQYYGDLATFIPMDNETAFVPVTTDSAGQVSVSVRLDFPVGLLAYAQWFFIDPMTGELLASNGLELTVMAP